MNPVLLKPGSDRTSQVVLLGKVFARGFGDVVPGAEAPAARGGARGVSGLEVAVRRGDLRGRRARRPRSTCGTGDLVNMGLARPLGMPVVVVGDIDRGGVFAAFHGTVALLDAEDQRLISGFIINKFRGDPSLLTPGLRQIEGFTGRPVLGVVPWLPGIRLDAEDALPIEAYATGSGGGTARRTARGCGSRWCASRGSRTSPTSTRWRSSRAWTSSSRRRPQRSSRRTWWCCRGRSRRSRTWRGCGSAGWRRRWRSGRPSGRPILGICGGYQMLGSEIEDSVESRRGTVAGLGLLPVRTVFDPVKTLTRPAGFGLGEPVTGYEIHNGQVAGHRRRPPVHRRLGRSPGRLPRRRGVGHDLARRAGERRLPPRVPGAGRGGLRRALRARTRRSRSRRSARSSSTASATRWRSTWTRSGCGG